MNKLDKSTTAPQSASLFKRIAAGIYDTLLLIALFVVPTLALMAVRGGEPVPAGDPLLQVLLALTAAAFFVGFWKRAGQTVGMRAWRLRVVSDQGGPLSLKSALLRFAASIPAVACFGLGVLWALFDKDKKTLQDRVANTRVIVLPKE